MAILKVFARKQEAADVLAQSTLIERYDAFLLDNHQGFGRVNVDRSVTRTLATIDGPGLKTGDRSTVKVKVTSARKTLRLALCYSDVPGRKTINNMNLIVTDPAGTRYVGNRSSSTGRALTLDATNNVELVRWRERRRVRGPSTSSPRTSASAPRTSRWPRSSCRRSGPEAQVHDAVPRTP